MDSPAYNRRLTVTEWAQYEAKITRLYLEEDKSLAEVLTIMAKEDDFRPSKSQLVTQLKKWAVAKNHKKKDWSAIAAHLQARQRAGKETEVLFKGRVVQNVTVQRETRRHGRAEIAPQQALVKPVPPGFRLRTPPPDRFLDHHLLPTEDLLMSPSHSFRISRPMSPFIDPKMLLGYHVTHSISVDVPIDDTGNFDTTSQMDIHLAIKVFFPCRSLPEEVLGMTGHALDRSGGMVQSRRALLLTFASIVTFAARNNIFQPDKHPEDFREAWAVLKTEAGGQLFSNTLAFIHLFPSPIDAAVTRHLFQYAIEDGDVCLVRDLLMSPVAALRPNEDIFLDIFSKPRTAVELASMYWRREVIKILIQQGCDASKIVDSPSHARGSLACAMSTFRFESKFEKLEDLRKSNPDGILPEIVNLLLSVGASPGPAISIVRHKNVACPQSHQLLFSAASPQEHAKSFTSGALKMMIDIMDDETVSCIFSEILSRPGADTVYRQSDSALRSDLLRTVIRRKHSSLLRLLLAIDASIVDSATFSTAIGVGDADLVRLLAEYTLKQGLRIHKTAEALISAVQSQRENILDIIEAGGVWDLMTYEDCEKVLHAAFKARDFVRAERILDRLDDWQEEPSLLLPLSPSSCHPLTRAYGLTVAASSGKTQLVLKLLDGGADINYKPSIDEGSALAHALRGKHAGIVDLLIDRPDIDLELDTSILLRAVEWGDLTIVKTLIRAGVPATSGSAFKLAVENKNLALVEMLLEHGASPSISLSQEKLEAYSEEDKYFPSKFETPLSTAAYTRDAAMVSFLLSQGAEVADTEAIEFAISNCDEEILKIILGHYQNRYPQGRCLFALRAMSIAVTSGNYMTVKRLLDAGIRFSRLSWRKSDELGLSRLSMNPTTPLCDAIRMEGEQSITMMRVLLDDGFDPEAIIARGLTRRQAFGEVHFLPETALLVAIRSKQPRAAKVKMLVEAGADVNARPWRGVRRTPLQKATEVGDIELVELLINLGANVDAPGSGLEGGTALKLAAERGFVGIMDRLLREGANPDLQGPRKLTALHIAAINGCIDAVQLLLNFGASPQGPSNIYDARAFRKHRAVTALLQAFEKDNGSVSRGDVMDTAGGGADATSRSNMDDFDVDNLIRWD